MLEKGCMVHSIVLSSGRTVSFCQYGDSCGKPLLYFHGWPSSQSQASSLHELALRRKIRILAMDRPGIGRSDHQPGRTLMDWPKLVAEFTDRLRIGQFYAHAVSGGSLYALALAKAMPERLLGVSIVCGAPNFASVGGQESLPFQYRALLVMYARLRPWLHLPFDLGLLLARQRATDFPMSTLLKIRLCELDAQVMLEQGELEVIARSYREAWTGNIDALITEAEIYLNPLGFNLAEVTYPIHYWHGEKDRNIPIALGRKMADLLPNAIRHWMPEDGHFSLPVLRGQEIFEAVGL